MTAQHVHQWSSIGLLDGKGGMSTPCVGCWDELSREYGIIKDGFKPSFPLEFVPDTDGITRLVCREIERDYKLDDLDILPGDTIIDIGAHKGIVSCYLAWKYPQARIVSFEPVAENYAALLKNIKLNGLTNIEPHNVAVTWDGRDVEVFADTHNNSGGATLYGSGPGRVVKSIRAADLFSAPVALLKIDCEGAEFEILPSISLGNIAHLRGEFHRANGNAVSLLRLCQAHISDVIITMQG